MRVEVRPLPVKKWHGKQGKDSFAQPKTIEVLYDSETGAMATGLSPEDAEKYGKAMGVDLGNTFNPNEPHPYWSSKAAWIPLNNQTFIFETTRNVDYVKVANLKASKYVANSMAEYNEGKWPDATHVIFSEEEEMELKSSKFQLQQKAAVKLVDLSTDAKTSVVRVLSKKPVTGRSANFIDGMLAELIDEDPKEVIRVLDMGKEEVTLRATILEALQKNVLTKQGEAVFFMGEKLGIDYEDAVQYFKDPNHAAMKVRILEKIQA